MEKLVLSLIALCCFVEFKAQSWVELDTPSGVYPLALDFINPNEGWVIDNYSLIHTVDGGLTWDLQEVPTDNMMNSICFISETHGWIAADYGTVYHTTDGGVSWVAQETGELYSLRKILFIDELHGWTIGFGSGVVGTFYYTIDGGQNWLPTECPCLFNDIDFYSQTQGWMVCDNGHTYSTYDGGVTIEALNLNNDITLKNVDFINDGIGWRVGESSLFQQSLNGGLNWFDEVSPLDVFLIDGLSFASTSVGAISGSSSVAVTLDGGDTWSVTQIPNAYIRDVEMINEFSGFATTVNGVIKYCGLNILTQPESIVTSQGSPAQLYAQASIFGASYQWQAFILGEWVNLQDNGEYTGTTNNVFNIAAAYGTMTFRCVISFEGCSITTNEVTVQGTVGIEEANSKRIGLYPNPVQDFITLQNMAGSSVLAVQIFDNSGRLLLDVSNLSGNQILVDTLESGRYILSITTQDSQLRIPFIKI
ncbi:MAG: YCF48-related protein [Flavobacteriales bacterium]